MLMTLLKIYGAILFALVALVGCQAVRNSGNDTLVNQAKGTLRLATYNVHYIILGQDTGPWPRGDWERRKGPMALAFHDMNADVIGFQEMESFARGSEGEINLTLDWLLANNGQQTITLWWPTTG